ncbi:MAG TPA: class I SAM-dependent methyltransferase [Verrucomicrobiae bacterium]|nr:class I SAM-dependent methyltransferase [Verrucomicrobiae bacterium]
MSSRAETPPTAASQGGEQLQKSSIAPEEREAFYQFNGRLALFQSTSADKDHWEKRWSKANLAELLKAFSTGKLDEFEGIFGRHLPKDARVLEAGCGNGQLVKALSARGYKVEGIDYAVETVRRIQEVDPSLKVRTGDIYQLDVPDETYGGYISIGLFEHNEAGPDAALRETRRVLSKKGVALISVPYLNNRRARMMRRAPVSKSALAPDGLSFYQYYYSRAEFQERIERAGMKVVECLPYGVLTGITRQHPFWEWLDRSRLFIWPLQTRFIHWCANAPQWARFKYAHMIMFACMRAEAG